MSKSIKKILKQMEESPGNVRFEDLCKDGKAKAYQVRQVVKAIDKLESE